MKVMHIALFSSAIACAGGMYWLQQSVLISTPPDLLAPVELPMISPAVQPPEVVQEIKTPVQPLEERDDAMLFEIEALAGTPFDQSILMPFD